MLAMFRRFLNTWAARAFFIVLLASFGLWGVSGVVQDMTVDHAVANVGSRRIEAGEFQDRYRRALDQVSRMLGGRTQPTPAVSRMVAGQALDRMVLDAALDEQASQLGIAVPQDDVRRTVFDVAEFKGLTGAFDRAKFNAIMRDNNLTEPRYLDGVRSSLARQQLLDAVAAGAGAPDTLARVVFTLQRETRVAGYVELSFDAAPEPPAPTADDLQRHYDNNLPSYSAAEFRRIKAVVLSPETIARAADVTDAEVQAYWDAHSAELSAPEKRSVRIAITPDEEKARSLAAAWIGGTSWDDLQKKAQPGGTAISLDDVTAAEIPSPELAAAVFAAAPDVVAGPVASALGYQVFQVTKITPAANATLADAAPGIRGRIARERAVDGIDGRINLLEDAVAASPTLEEIPADIGAAALAGSLDAQGNTPEGGPAPIPGTPVQRQAVITAAFALSKGEPPRLTEGPEGSYFAVMVEDMTPSAPKPFAEVEAQVREDWLHAARRKSQEAAAAKLLGAAQAGGSLDDAATVAGLRVQRTPPLSRAAPPPGIAPELAEAAFRLKLHEVTMVETPGAFLVMDAAGIAVPDMAADPLAAGQIRRQLAGTLSQDLQTMYAAAVRARLRPSVNQRVLDGIVRPPS